MTELYGTQTLNAIENFNVSGYKWCPEFIISYAQVKFACAEANFDLGYLDKDKFERIKSACLEIINGKYHDQIVVDALQGGAGTSTNMNFNEVIGSISDTHPLNDVNMHQSTNDTFPTALKITLIKMLEILEVKTTALQEAFQYKEQEFANVIKTGRTQMQKAVPITLGQEFGAYGQAIARDRWRIFKSRERIKQINLGGTAIGTGIGAPQKYILKVHENLKKITGLKIARAEDLVDATQNLDDIVEVSGFLKAYAANLFKISGDLRLLSLLGEIILPKVQTGSSIMPSKVNPVIPEMVQQVALKVMNSDALIAQAASLGNLELNQFMPLIAFASLESLTILIKAVTVFKVKCVDIIEAAPQVCEKILQDNYVLATIFVPKLGYEKVEEIIKKATSLSMTLEQILIQEKVADKETIHRLLSPQNMKKLGFDDGDFTPFKK